MDDRMISADDHLDLQQEDHVTMSRMIGALENDAPDLGYDDGGRQVAAWLDR